MRASSLLVVLATTLGACGSPDATTGDSVDGSAVSAEASGGSGDAAVGEGSAPPAELAESQPELAPVLLEPKRVERASAASPIGAAGGGVVAGAMTVNVPPGTLAEPIVLSVEILGSPDELGRVLPDQTLLGAYRAQPWNAPYNQAIDVEIPLFYSVEPGTMVELLGWQPSMRAFLVIGREPVDSTGTRALFHVRQLGDMIVRAAPRENPIGGLECDGASLRLEQAWPQPSEDAVTGLVPIESRLPRERAFSVLTDARLTPIIDRVEFKNEEIVDSLATRRNELDHRDEDFLLDPNGAAALEVLGQLVEREWTDPLSGKPAFRLRVTDAYDALIEHSRQSTHYQGRAIDLTLSPVPAANGDERRDYYGRLSRLAICAGFDFVWFENLAHIHVSVVPSRVAALTRDGEGRYRVHGAPLNDLDSWSVLVDAVSTLQGDPVAVDWTDEGVWLRFGEGASSRWLRVLPDGNLSIAGTPPTGDATLSSDWARRLRVVRERGWLAYGRAVVPVGTVNADGLPVHLEHTVGVGPEGEQVIALAFRRHRLTDEARRRFLR